MPDGKSQNSNYPDGAFAKTDKVDSPAFGQSNEADKGAVPGKAQQNIPAGAGRAE